MVDWKIQASQPITLDGVPFEVLAERDGWLLGMLTIIGGETCAHNLWRDISVARMACLHATAT